MVKPFYIDELVARLHTVTRRAAGASASTLTIADLDIANTADPIPPDERDHIFDRFARGRAARDASREGTGLGLSLAREILTAHHATLALDTSEHSPLTHFHVSIPTPSYELSMRPNQ